MMAQIVISPIPKLLCYCMVWPQCITSYEAALVLCLLFYCRSGQTLMTCCAIVSLSLALSTRNDPLFL
ncbi:hypothetical protein DRM94_09475 [Aeromonas taiwanensis]|uniref:Uncharacterized protein n=1 Tax=Aeromonas taiwanensis TaxID=633417 RepID=A0A5F0KC69_9GAMM|nr:hypothetical protein DRM93_09475 [Aeromonas taiwanensis]TFF80973.1 hypothetical protein DRM94_09475 [Aeromonas taiwanensis]